MQLITRLVITLIVLASAFAAAAAFNVALQQRISTSYALLGDVLQPSQRQLRDLERSLSELQVAVRDDDERLLMPALRLTVAMNPPGQHTSETTRALSSDLTAAAPRDRTGARYSAFVDQLTADVATLDAHAAHLDATLNALVDTAERSPQPGSEHVRTARDDAEAALQSTRVALRSLSDAVQRQLLATRAQLDRDERATRRTIIATAALLAIGTLLAVVLVHRLLTPMRQLTRAAAQIVDGDEPERLTATTRRDEVGTLARTFEHMLTTLGERDRSLRQRNAELQDAYARLLHEEQARIASERLAAIGELSSRITHELRNPLSTLAMNLEMLRDALDGDGEEARELLDVVEREVMRLESLSDGYLMLARRPAPEPTAVPVADVAREIVTLYQRTLDAVGITLSADVQAPDARALADDNGVRQLLINLVQNAREALLESDVTGGTITVRIDRVAGDATPGSTGRAPEALADQTSTRNTGHQSADHRSSDHQNTDEGLVRICVQDNGPGVPAHQRARLFEAFHTTRRDGTGLGLSICRRMVIGWGGTLELEDTPTGGARFVATLRSARPGSTTGAHAPNLAVSDRAPDPSRG